MNTIVLRAGKSKKLVLSEKDRIFIGVDVHKKSYSVALWSKERDCLLHTWSQPSSWEDLLAHLFPLKKYIEEIVYEAGPSGYSLARHIDDHGLPVKIISPLHTPQSRKKGAKSDRIDARKLAKYACHQMLNEVYLLSQQQEADRQVVRTREQVINNFRRVKCQIKSFLLLHDLERPVGLKYWSDKAVEELRAMELPKELRKCLDNMIKQYDQIKVLVKEVYQDIKDLSRQERYREDFKRFCTAPGVGLITAMTYLVELPQLDLIENHKQLGSLLGLSPCVRSSGEMQLEQGRDSGGKARVRTLLVEAAWRWIGNEEMARKRFEQYLVNTGSRKKAITAMARKLAIKLWAMYRKRQNYIPMEDMAKAA